ncbi:hypothetical protein F5884DRAFT_206491 [Xylogone sp. PMI_703]|nr:hypothetical protein F5884DRAFT_206491 [Xylogone sp. PMI_703]
MNRSRYQPVSQHDSSEPIILSPINTASYNYNTALPNSVAPSAPSIPSSPPPSFHSSQSVNGHIDASPGTPREAAHANVQEWNNLTPTAIIGESFGEPSGSDAQMQIAALKARVERLEECIGRLMLDKEESNTSLPHEGRTNCCVTFTDVPGDFEQAFSRRAGNNCCVQFRSSSHQRKPHPLAIIIIIGMFALLITAIATMSKLAGVGKNST